MVLVPVPWEPTVSYRRGAAKGPGAILRASRQVDLFDLHTGRPYEQGIAMLSSVLKSKQAIQINIEIMRAFVHIRRWLVSHRELGERIEAFEKKVDGQFKIVFHALDALNEPPPSPPPPPPRRIGFKPRGGLVQGLA